LKDLLYLLDTVALSLDLGLQALHFVPVEGIGNIPTDVDVRHFEVWEILLKNYLTEEPVWVMI